MDGLRPEAGESGVCGNHPLVPPAGAIVAVVVVVIAAVVMAVVVWPNGRANEFAREAKRRNEDRGGD